MSSSSANNDTNQSHLVFSDISHLGAGAGSLPTIKFAVGLREDLSADELLGKIMPLTKVIPGKPIEKAPREKKQAIEKDCSRGDCQSKKIYYLNYNLKMNHLENKYEQWSQKF